MMKTTFGYEARLPTLAFVKLCRCVPDLSLVRTSGASGRFSFCFLRASDNCEEVLPLFQVLAALMVFNIHVLVKKHKSCDQSKVVMLECWRVGGLAGMAKISGLARNSWLVNCMFQQIRMHVAALKVIVQHFKWNNLFTRAHCLFTCSESENPPSGAFAWSPFCKPSCDRLSLSFSRSIVDALVVDWSKAWGAWSKAQVGTRPGQFKTNTGQVIRQSEWVSGQVSWQFGEVQKACGLLRRIILATFSVAWRRQSVRRVSG